MDFSDTLIYLNAFAEKEKDDYKQMLSIAHKLAIWTRCDPKKFPELKDIFEDIEKNHEKAKGIEQTPSKMFDIVKSLHLKFGGK